MASMPMLSSGNRSEASMVVEFPKLAMRGDTWTFYRSEAAKVQIFIFLREISMVGSIVGMIVERSLGIGVEPISVTYIASEGSYPSLAAISSALSL